VTPDLNALTAFKFYIQLRCLLNIREINKNVAFLILLDLHILEDNLPYYMCVLKKNLLPSAGQIDKR